MKSIWMIAVYLIFSTQLSWADSQIGLPVGTKAPDFIAQNYKGQEVRFSDSFEEGFTVLVFYRGGWCPYCNLHLKSIQEKISDFSRLGADVFAVSVDTPESAFKTVEQYELDFEVISSSDAKILEDYNLVFTVPEDLNKKYKEEYNIDLEAASGRTDGVIAVPGVFIINPDGVIVYSYSNLDYKVRMSPDEILAELKKAISESS